MVNINPLIAQPPSEVPLENAPLIRVLAQVRFPFLFSIKEISCVAAFQEAIREKYPILQPEQTQGLLLATQGFVPTEPQIIWRFTDINREWRVSLTPNFVTLETVAYSSRTDFLERLENILTALDLHTKPNYIERFGLRYIDRLEEQDIYEIQKLVRQEVAGVSTELKEYVYQAISEYIFNLPEDRGQMLARWGLLPANATIDPTAVEPIGKPSWILDLDMSLSRQREFNISVIMDEAHFFAERIYTFFRWVVTDDFLRHFGGKV